MLYETENVSTYITCLLFCFLISGVNVFLSSWNDLLWDCISPLHRRRLCVWLRSAAVCEVHYPPNEPVKNSAVFVWRYLLKTVCHSHNCWKSRIIHKVQHVAPNPLLTSLPFFDAAKYDKDIQDSWRSDCSSLITGTMRSTGFNSNQRSHFVNDRHTFKVLLSSV